MTDGPENQGNNKTLSRFKPGQSGNPNGRPKKGNAMTDLLEQFFSEKDPDTEVDRKRAFIAEGFKRAMAGSDEMYKYLWDRLEGKPDVFKHIFNEEIPQIIISMKQPDA